MAKDKVYVLNPGYQLRNDVHRVALFAKVSSGSDCSKDWHTFIHPIQAAMLSFFTYNRSLDENLRLLSRFFSRDIGYMEKTVSSYMENPTPVYTLWKEQRICFPKNILIELEKAGEAFHFLELTTDSFMGRKLDLTSRRFYSGPLLVTLMLTNRCLTHCRYCYADTATLVKQALPTTRILELIREAAGLPVQQVNLIGGEIFLHKDWKVIVSELVKRDIAPEYISTKMPFTGKRLSDLKETGFHALIQVSLDAANSDVLQESLQVSEHYLEEMKKGLQLLDQSGLDYQVSSVLTAYNCNRHTLVGLFRFLSTLKHLREWRIVPVSNSITMDYSELARLKAPKELIESVFDHLENKIVPISSFPIVLSRELIHKQFYTDSGGSACFKGATCSALNTHLFILPDGKVTICEQLYWNPRFVIGDVNHSSLKEVWDSPQALSLLHLSRKEIQGESRCAECCQFEHCFGAQNRCWSDIIKAYGADCWDYPDPRCEFAPRMSHDLGY